MSRLRDRCRADLAGAEAARRIGDVDEAWRLLEEAHVLSQPFAWLHVRSHLAMLGLAMRTADRQEAFGQVVRVVVAGPGSLSGRVPVGNTGRARVPLREELPVPVELQALLDEASG